MRLLLFALLALTCIPAESNAAPADGCVVSGCGELCLDADEAKGVGFACSWTPAYDCYQKVSECKRQINGECGWTPTAALADCLKNPDAFTTPSAKSKP